MAIYIAGAVAFLLGVFPVLHHFMFGLRERKREILCVLNDDAIRLYFNQFYHAEATELNKNPRVELGKIYDQRFGFRTFVLPTILYFVALGVVVGIVCAAAGAHFSLDLIGMPIGKAAAYALAGAYLWVLSDLISRYRLRNLVPSSLYAATFRMVIAIPLASAITVLFKEDFGGLIGFMLGVFPTDTLFLIVRRQVGQKFGLGEDWSTQTHELEALQGVNTSIAETFSDIGVTTLVQLAYGDPIQLTMRANLSFYFVLDVVSQALVAIYMDPAIARRYSIRGSVEATALDSLYHPEPPPPPAPAPAPDPGAQQTVTSLSGDLHVPEGVVGLMLDQIAGDPCARA